MVSRRELLGAAGAFGADALLGQRLSQAQSWPARPIKLVVPYSAGGMTDIVGRSFSERLSALVGQPVVVENKPGAGTMLGTASVANSPADGYTLLMVSGSAFTTNPAVSKKMPYDAQRDFSPIAAISTASNVIIVKEPSPYRTLREFVDEAKRSPGKLAFSSYGVGTGTHLMGSMFQSVAGIDLIHVPYGGVAPAVQAVIAGDVALGFDTLFTAIPRAASRQVRILAITQSQRAAELPDVPTTEEAGYPNMNIPAWLGLCAPSNTPAAIIDRLSQAVVAIQADQAFAARLKASGTEMLRLTRPQFIQMMAEEANRIRTVVAKFNISAD